MKRQGRRTVICVSTVHREQLRTWLVCWYVCKYFGAFDISVVVVEEYSLALSLVVNWTGPKHIYSQRPENYYLYCQIIWTIWGKVLPYAKHPLLYNFLHSEELLQSRHRSRQLWVFTLLWSLAMQRPVDFCIRKPTGACLNFVCRL